MSKHVLTDAVITVGGVALSGWCKAVNLEYNAEAKDITAMGDGTVVNAGGLKSWSVSLELLQDYAASAPDITIFSLVGTTVAFTGKPTSGSVSTTNPRFDGSMVVTGYTPIGGSVGDVHMTRLDGVSAGTLTRNTS